ncbi:hypothetical protein AB0H00_27875 [Nocardia sp. NPDC023852]|uniref:hypothetical protein n=1 Tax=Nocardia sp. NPDC023852 TaxID=3154697 RepID=UPI00340DF5BB
MDPNTDHGYGDVPVTEHLPAARELPTIGPLLRDPQPDMANPGSAHSRTERLRCAALGAPSSLRYGRAAAGAQPGWDTTRHNLSVRNIQPELTLCRIPCSGIAAYSVAA